MSVESGDVVLASVCETKGNGVMSRLGYRSRAAPCSCRFRVGTFAAACPYG